MSITWLPREQGLAVRCNGHACTQKFYTGNVIAKHTRAWLKKEKGWGRGSRAATKNRLGTKRHDLCPPCLKLDKELAAADAKEAAARKEARREAKKLKLVSNAEAKKIRAAQKEAKRAAKLAASPSVASLPSPDSASSLAETLSGGSPA